MQQFGDPAKLARALLAMRASRRHRAASLLALTSSGPRSRRSRRFGGTSNECELAPSLDFEAYSR